MVGVQTTHCTLKGHEYYTLKGQRAHSNEKAGSARAVARVGKLGGGDLARQLDKPSVCAVVEFVGGNGEGGGGMSSCRD